MKLASLGHVFVSNDQVVSRGDAYSVAKGNVANQIEQAEKASLVPLNVPGLPLDHLTARSLDHRLLKTRDSADKPWSQLHLQSQERDSGFESDWNLKRLWSRMGGGDPCIMIPDPIGTICKSSQAADLQTLWSAVPLSPQPSTCVTLV